MEVMHLLPQVAVMAEKVRISEPDREWSLTMRVFSSSVKMLLSILSHFKTALGS